MNKEMAQKIFALSRDYEKIAQEKYEIQKSLGVFNWEQACTKAMEVMMLESAGGNK